MNEEKSVIQKLFSLQDLNYRQFILPLIPTVSPQKVIGIRTPELRKLAKEIYKGDTVKDFLNALPHYYYEENNLHAFLIEQIKDYNECVTQLKRFLPLVDNWATCDGMSPKVLLRHKDLLVLTVKEFLSSNEVYLKRFAIITAMRAFCGNDYNGEIACLIASIKSNEYYVNMAIGWFFATLLAKNPTQALVFIKQKRLNETAHNFAIKKARESLRVSKELKSELLKYKI